MSGAFDVSVVVPTCNRAAGLPLLLDRLLAQEAGDVRFEIVVVDNNSSDGTRAAVAAYVREAPHPPLGYVFEPRQGVSYARNTGVAHARAPIILFLDDDGVPVADWVRSMKRAFDEYPEADCIGGRVRPRWTHRPPPWMTAAHWGPIALQDRPRPAWFDRRHASACLLTANLGCRREAFEAVGGFDPAYRRNQDREFEMRLWRAGRRGLYLPGMDVIVDVPPDRLTRRYHRRWQATTGKYHALMRYRDTVDADGVMIEEAPGTRRLFGSPLFLYRELLQHAAGWMSALVGGDGPRRFLHETRVWYSVSFFWTRWQEERRRFVSPPAPDCGAPAASTRARILPSRRPSSPARRT